MVVGFGSGTCISDLRLCDVVKAVGRMLFDVAGGDGALPKAALGGLLVFDLPLLSESGYLLVSYTSVMVLIRFGSLGLIGGCWYLFLFPYSAESVVRNAILFVCCGGLCGSLASCFSLSLGGYF